MGSVGVEHVAKACAYITRNESELLVFSGPEHDGLQIPKGTIEPGETPRSAVHREIVEESGLTSFDDPEHLVTDVWQRRKSPPKRYIRNFYHTSVHEPRDSWTHTVTGSGAERGLEFEFSWVTLPTDATFALSLDDYTHLVPSETNRNAVADRATD